MTTTISRPTFHDNLFKVLGDPAQRSAGAVLNLQGGMSYFDIRERAERFMKKIGATVREGGSLGTWLHQQLTVDVTVGEVPLSLLGAYVPLVMCGPESALNKSLFHYFHTVAVLWNLEAQRVDHLQRQEGLISGTADPFDKVILLIRFAEDFHRCGLKQDAFSRYEEAIGYADQLPDTRKWNALGRIAGALSRHGFDERVAALRASVPSEFRERYREGEQR